MSSPAIDPPRVTAPTDGERTAHWEHDRVARGRVSDLLRALPTGFVVFRDLALPKPSRAVIHHLVVGPRNVWAVTTHVLAEPVTFGSGRNVDTLWAGRTPLRTMLEAADWEASAAAGLLGVDVEPVVCLVAPGLPQPTFDFHGIHITSPNSLVDQVARSTADFVDVTAVSAAVSGVFDASPVAGTAAPTLGVPVLPGVHRPTHGAPRRRSLGARAHALKSIRAVRIGAALAVLGAVLAFLPAIIGLWDSVATEGAERLTDVIEEVDSGETDTDEAAVDEAPADVPPLAGVGYVLSCPAVGAGWVAAWQWPGALPDGVAGYSIRTQTGTAPMVVYPPLLWSDPTTAPPAARIASIGTTTVYTDHRSAAGEIVATTTTEIEPPNDFC